MNPLADVVRTFSFPSTAAARCRRNRAPRPRDGGARLPLRLALIAAVFLGHVLHALAGPEVSVSLQGIANDTVEQGEPLRVSVRIDVPDTDATAVTLAPASGTWADAVVVEILPAEREAALSRGLAVGRPDQPHATIDRERMAGGLWRFPADAIQRLALGSYRLRATLSVADGSGWKGTVASELVPLKVIAASNAPERAGLKTLALARDALLEGETERAARLLDAELTRDPKQFRLLLLRAAVAERAGNLLAAQMCLNAAGASVPETRGGYPNVEWMELNSRVSAARSRPTDTAGAVPTAPPGWSWPPDGVRLLVQ